VPQVYATGENRLPDAIGDLISQHPPARRADSKAVVVAIGHVKPLEMHGR
jgi:hypothetical protein